MSDGMYVGGGAVVAPPAVAAAASVASSLPGLLVLPAVDELVAPGVVAVAAPALLISSFFLAFGSVVESLPYACLLYAPVAAGPGSAALAAAFVASDYFFNLS
jgi:hypothetical protein